MADGRRGFGPSRAALAFGTFLALPVALFVAFFVYPIISTINLSLHDWNGVSPTMRFVGLRNYVTLFGQPRFLHALANNLSWLLFMLTCPTGLGLLLAAADVSNALSRMERSDRAIGFDLAALGDAERPDAI